MKPNETDKVLALLVLALLAIAIGCSGVGAQPPDSQADTASPPFSNEGITVSKGTPIYVRLQQPISSVTAEQGDDFSAVLDDAVTVNGRVVVPQGTAASGRVVAARKSGRLHDAGYIRLVLSSVTIKGKEIPIQTSSVFVEGGSYKNHSMAYMGGAVAGNSLMAALAGNGESGLVGSGADDSDGASAAYINGKKEVGFAADRRMSFRLIKAMNISSN